MSGFDLWDYQIDNIDKIEAAITAGEAPLYVLPTGGGKTVVAAGVINRAVERGERVLVLTHRREILMQTSKKLGIDHGLIQAGLNVDLEYPVQIASIQTLWARCMAHRQAVIAGSQSDRHRRSTPHSRANLEQNP